jgi:membrane protein DedA with SNARE-associated domain
MAPSREHLPYVLGTIAVMVAGSVAGAAFAPALLGYAPLTLVALSPLGRHLILVATVTPLVPFVVVASLRRAFAGVLAYLLGCIYGEDGMVWVERRYPRLGGLARVLERSFRRAGPLLLFLGPGLFFCALAGVIRMRFWLFLPLVLAGQIMWMTLTFYLGDALSEWIAPIVGFLNEYMLEATLASVVLVALYQLYRRRTRRSDALSELAAAADKPEL